MTKHDEILNKIRELVKSAEPNATIILYGSHARGDFKDNSDYDILILLNKNDISREDEIKVKYPLYDLEFETGKIISVLVLPKIDWEQKHKITPFYENVEKEGVVL